VLTFYKTCKLIVGHKSTTQTIQSQWWSSHQTHLHLRSTEETKQLTWYTKLNKN